MHCKKLLMTFCLFYVNVISGMERSKFSHSWHWCVGKCILHISSLAVCCGHVYFWPNDKCSMCAFVY